MAFLSICRICLQKSPVTKNLFDKESEEILNNIYVCFQITIELDESLPYSICNHCIEELKIADSFRIKCISFEEKFTSLYKSSLNKLAQENSKNGCDEVNDDSISIIFDDNTCLDETKRDTIENNKQNFPCNICGKILKTQKSLLKHEVSFHKNRKHVGEAVGIGAMRRYYCTKCSYSTPHSQTIVNHMRRHNGERPYKCDCGKSFTQSSSLAAHRKTHSNTTYFTCSVCGKQFKHAFALKTHQSVHESPNFICSICHKALKSKQSLKDHILRHNDIRNYNCDDCGDRFVTASELLNHKSKHKMEKNVECHLCGYKTNNKKNLTIHIKRHAGEKTIKCDVCDTKWYLMADLRRHQRVHTRDKPFQCPTCIQQFTHSSSLNKHMQTVHGSNYKWRDFKTKQNKKFKTVLKNELL